MKLFILFASLTLSGVACNVQPSYVVDISALIVKTDPEAVRQAKLHIDQGLRNNGLIVVTGHGLSSILADQSFGAARTLFELESSSKQEVAIRNDNVSFGRGYLGFGDESGLSSTFEPKEGFSYGNSLSSNASNLLSLRNKWPSALQTETIATFNTLYDEKVRVAHLIVNALSEMFTCSEASTTEETDTQIKATDLNDMISGGREISLMRLFHYFHQQSATVQEHLQKLRFTSTATNHGTTSTASTTSSTSPTVNADTTTTTTSSTTSTTSNTDTSATEASALPSMLGSSPHTDWGFLTLILADEVGGLQFIPKGGSVAEHNWVDVPYIPGSLVVNGGDYLKLISRGVYHSPVHRVLSPGSRGGVCGNGGSGGSGESGDKDGNSDSGDRDDKDDRDEGEGDTCPDRYSFVFFFYPSYSSLVSDHVLSHCTHYLQNITEGSNKGTTETGASAPPSAAQATIDSIGGASAMPQQAQGQTFNTLLSLEEGGRSATATATATGAHQFGDYVIKKWKGVYRREEIY